MVILLLENMDFKIQWMFWCIGWVALFLGVLVIYILVVEQKGGSVVKDIKVNIELLLDGNSFLVEFDVFVIIECVFDKLLKGQLLLDINMEWLEQVLEVEFFILDVEAYVNVGNYIVIDINF